MLDTPSVQRQAALTQRLEHEFARKMDGGGGGGGASPSSASAMAAAAAAVGVEAAQRERSPRSPATSPPRRGAMGLEDAAAPIGRMPGGGGGEYGSRAVLIERFNKLAEEWDVDLGEDAALRSPPRDRRGDRSWMP